MSLITWNDTLSIKVEEIDIQHRRLVELINELHDAMSQGKADRSWVTYWQASSTIPARTSRRRSASCSRRVILGIRTRRPLTMN